MCVMGMRGFPFGPALCGLARSPTALIGSRLLQGAFAAVMVPQVLSFIQVTFPPPEQSLAYALYGMTIGFGMIAGQLLGGLLLSADLGGLGWRPVFLVNLPFGVGAITLAWLLVRESRAPAGLELDPAGVVLLSAALVLLLDRKSTRLNSSHGYISYAVFCLKKKKKKKKPLVLMKKKRQL